MIKNKIFIDSVGITINITCRDYDYNLLDMSTATITELVVRKPSGDEVIWDATVDGTSHEILKYVTVDGDLDESGSYLVQGKIQIGSWLGYSETFEFKVYDLFEHDYH
jgi:bacillopeptidase F (M6 metalloprotease family)